MFNRKSRLIKHLQEVNRQLIGDALGFILTSFEQTSDEIDDTWKATAKVKMAPPFVAFMANQLKGMLEGHGAENFLSAEILCKEQGTDEPFELIVRRYFGKSTARVLGELQDENAALKAKVVEKDCPTTCAMGCCPRNNTTYEHNGGVMDAFKKAQP